MIYTFIDYQFIILMNVYNLMEYCSFPFRIQKGKVNCWSKILYLGCV